MFENHENPHGFSWKTIKRRLKKGMTFEQAMNTFIRKRGIKGIIHRMNNL